MILPAFSGAFSTLSPTTPVVTTTRCTTSLTFTAHSRSAFHSSAVVDTTGSSPTTLFLQKNDNDAESSLQTMVKRRGFGISFLAGLFTGLASYVTRGMAAADDMEYAELPPVYVPVVFGVALLVGVGVLTSTLGDVMDEGMLCMKDLCIGCCCYQATLVCLSFCAGCPKQQPGMQF